MSHYRRFRKYGDPTAGRMPNGIRGKESCSIEICTNLVFVDMLCKAHYSRRSLYGEAGLKIDRRRLAGEPCDACGEYKDKEVMFTDHCHITGQVRGLLCMWCNMTLGYVKDNPSKLRALADYLEKFTEP